MLELGQPLHAFDRTKLTGEIVVRRAEPGERLETLDHVVRDAGPGRHPDHRRVRADLDGRHHGRPGHRDRRDLHRPGDRGRALLDARGSPEMSRRHKLHQRGVLPVRAGRRPRAAAARQRQGGGPAGRAGRRPAWCRAARTLRPRCAPVADLDGGGLPGQGGRGGLRPGHRGPAAARGGLLGAPDARRPRRPSPRGGVTRPARHRRAALTAAAAPVTGARGDPAVLAARPDRPGRPGRGGHPAGRLREHPGPDAARAGRARAHRRASGCAARSAGRWPRPGTSRCSPTRSVAADDVDLLGLPPDDARRPARRGGQPAERGRAAAAHHAAARPAPGAGPQRRAGLRRRRAVRDRAWSSARARSGGTGAHPAGATAGRPRPRSWPRWKRPCPTSRCASASCWPGSASSTGWWGKGRAASLGGRDRGGPGDRPRSAGSRSTSAPTSTRPGTRAAAPPSTSRSRTPTAAGVAGRARR